MRNNAGMSEDDDIERLRRKKVWEWNSDKMDIGKVFIISNYLSFSVCQFAAGDSSFKKSILKQSSLVFLGLSIYGWAACMRFLRISEAYKDYDAETALARGQALEEETRKDIVFKYHPALLLEK
jgi:hypothetical protein